MNNDITIIPLDDMQTPKEDVRFEVTIPEVIDRKLNYTKNEFDKLKAETNDRKMFLTDLKNLLITHNQLSEPVSGYSTTIIDNELAEIAITEARIAKIEDSLISAVDALPDRK